MRRSLLLKCLVLTAILAANLVVAILVFHRDGKADPLAGTGEETEREQGEKVIELPKELNDLLVEKWLRPGLEKAIASALDQFRENLYTEFEIKDEVEKMLFSLSGGENWVKEGDSLIAWCVVKPGPKALPARLYRKQCEQAIELKCARVIAPVSKPVALFFGRSKEGVCRLSGSAAYDPITKKWKSQADVLKGESEEVRRAVAGAVKGIDPKMVAVAGLP
jgi:hypothetical protein